MFDPIADMVAQICNANHKLRETVDIPSSKLKVEVARVLKEEGYINNFKVAPDRRQPVLRLTLKYTPQKERVIKGMKRISKSSLRIYCPQADIPAVENGMGTAILSTSKGVLADRLAREKNVGGEVLCTVW